jgi:hypothetical protein
MPFPSYLSAFRPPTHHNVYRRVMQDEKISFSLSESIRLEDVARNAALLFLPAHSVSSDLRSGEGPWGAAPVKLKFHGDKSRETSLKEQFDGIAQMGWRPAEKGLAVLTAIAEAIFPALDTGVTAKTVMARAAAMEIAVAIANRSTLNVGTRAAIDAVNGEENPLGCGLGSPSEWGIELHTERKGRISLCESAAWDQYCRVPDTVAKDNRMGDSQTTTDEEDRAKLARARTPSGNVESQDGKVLITNVCTTFTVKSGEWWLTRKLLPHRPQHATVTAKIRPIWVKSTDKTMHAALSYENGSVRHSAWNWLAFLCRWMRGIRTTKVDKGDYQRKLLPREAIRERVPSELFGRDDSSWHSAICPAERGETIRKRAELVDDEARRVGRRCGTWSGESRYHGKVDLVVRFAPGKPAEPENQTVELVGVTEGRGAAYHGFPGANVAPGPQRSPAPPDSSRPGATQPLPELDEISVD